MYYIHGSDRARARSKHPYNQFFKYWRGRAVRFFPIFQSHADFPDVFPIRRVLRLYVRDLRRRESSVFIRLCYINQIVQKKIRRKIFVKDLLFRV